MAYSFQSRPALCCLRRTLLGITVGNYGLRSNVIDACHARFYLCTISACRRRRRELVETIQTSMIIKCQKRDPRSFFLGKVTLCKLRAILSPRVLPVARNPIIDEVLVYYIVFAMV